MTNFKEAADTILRYLKISTFPLAVKYVNSAKEFPDRAKRPSMLGMKMPFCQINTIARKWGWTMAVTPEEVNCAAALLAFGWGELGPEVNREEELINFMISAGYVKDSNAAKRTLEKMMFLTGEKKISSKGLTVAPLVKGVIEDPDVILIYGNAAQMARLVQSMVYMEGGVIESQAQIGLSCVGEMIKPMAENKAGFIIPGRGERRLGMAADDELAFALPAGKLDDLFNRNSRNR